MEIFFYSEPRQTGGHVFQKQHQEQQDSSWPCFSLPGRFPSTGLGLAPSLGSGYQSTPAFFCKSFPGKVNKAQRYLIASRPRTAGARLRPTKRKQKRRPRPAGVDAAFNTTAACSCQRLFYSNLYLRGNSASCANWCDQARKTAGPAQRPRSFCGMRSSMRWGFQLPVLPSAAAV